MMENQMIFSEKCTCPWSPVLEYAQEDFFLMLPEKGLSILRPAPPKELNYWGLPAFPSQSKNSVAFLEFLKEGVISTPQPVHYRPGNDLEARGSLEKPFSSVLCFGS